MALAIDASTPAMVLGVSGAQQTLTTGTFSPPASSLLVLMVQNTTDSTVLTSISDSLGSHLTYTKLIAITNTGNCSAEIWVANCPSSQTNMTVTVTWTTSVANGLGLSTGLAVMTGAATTQNGATGTQSASSLPNVSVTTLQNNSWVFGSIADGGAGGAITTGANQTIVFNSLTFSKGSPSAWCQRQNATTASSGTNVTINDTAPGTTDAISVVVAEIIPSVAVAGIPDLIMAPAHR